jgi:hypothetical protein
VKNALLLFSVLLLFAHNICVVQRYSNLVSNVRGVITFFTLPSHPICNYANQSHEAPDLHVGPCILCVSCAECSKF